MPASGRFGLGSSGEHQPPIVRFYDDVPPPMEDARRRPLNGWAIASSISSALCCVPGAGLFGIIFGAVAVPWHRHIRRRDGEPPRLTLLAWFGIIFGIPTLLFWSGLIGAATLFENRSEEVKTFSNRVLRELVEQDPKVADYLDAETFAQAVDFKNEQIAGRLLTGPQLRVNLTIEDNIQGPMDAMNAVSSFYTGPWIIRGRLFLLNETDETVLPIQLRVVDSGDGLRVSRVELGELPSSRPAPPTTEPEAMGMDASPATPPDEPEEPRRVILSID